MSDSRIAFQRSVQRVACTWRIARIVHPPRKLLVFLEDLPKRLSKDFDLLRDFPVMLRKLDGDLLEEVDYWLKQGLTGLSLTAMDDLVSGVDRVWGHLDKLDYYADLFRKTTDDREWRRSILKSVHGSVGYALEDFHLLDSLRKDILGAKGALRESREWREVPKRIYDSLYELPPVIESLKARLLAAQEKLAEALKFSNPYFQHNDEIRPKSEKTETLYHTSISARDLYRKGFSPSSVRQQVKGLGGSQTDKAGNPSISFTSDLYVAKEISRSLKEAVSIANGKVKGHQVLDWARREGILAEVEKAFYSFYGRDHAPPKTPGEIMYVYQAYLMFSESTSKASGRYNPVYVGDYDDLMRAFRGVSERDIGIIVATVDMSDPNILYLAAMHEYRVTAESVVSIDKFI